MIKKLKIVLSYPSEYDQGEGIHYSRVLRRLGHEVFEINVASNECGPKTHGKLVQGYPAHVSLHEIFQEYDKPDLFLYIEPMGLIPFGLNNSPIPTACVISDVHRNLKFRQNLAKLFDHVFLYQRNYVDSFLENDKATVHWLPYACDIEVFQDLKLNRDLDIAFIGKLFGDERKRIIHTLSEKYQVNEQRYYLQKEIPEVYSRAKMVLNLPLGDDLNFRFFEALSCGALLLTKRILNGQEHLFEENVHYVTFSCEKELLEKVEYYLQNERERRAIALNGYKQIAEKHSLTLRINALLEKVMSGVQFAAPVRKMKQNDMLKLYASIYERYGRVEALIRLATEQRGEPFLRLWVTSMGLKSFARRVIAGW